jgi:hypothetical protein
MAGAAVRAMGRTRTAPAPGTVNQRLRFAFASCPQYEQGYYAAHRHMAREDLELVVFLGDYIYESSGAATSCAGTMPENPLRWTNTATATRYTSEARRQRDFHRRHFRRVRRPPRRASGLTAATQALYSALMPARLITRTYLSMSLRMVAANCSGVSAIVS